MKTRAAIVSVCLSLLFVVVYSSTNFLASQRTDVGTWYYEWELAIPFVPLMIIPYMSIDLFFVIAPFLCRDRRELAVFSYRVCFAIVVAGFIFAIFPLRLAFERHPVEGWLGAIFNPFLTMDKPFNLLPSLHIALRTILADLYTRKTRGIANVLLHIWFSLVGLSTLLTHQHQVVDVIGGFVLAGYSIYLFRHQAHTLPVIPNRVIASIYGLSAVAMTALFAIVWYAGWREGIIFLWPAIAAAIVAMAYIGLGPGVYRKTEGRLPLSTRFVLGPVLVAHYLSLLYYRRQCRPWDAVTSQVLIGRQLDDTLARRVLDDGVTAVLDLTAESSEAKPLLSTTYRQFPILDLTAPAADQLSEMAAFIAEHTKQGRVYVHCKIGYSRSAAAVAAYLLHSGRARHVEEAIEQLRAARPSIVVRPEVRAALVAYADKLQSRQDRFGT